MSSGHLSNFQKNFRFFCKFWILVHIDRSHDTFNGILWQDTVTDFVLGFFFFCKLNSHGLSSNSIVVVNVSDYASDDYHAPDGCSLDGRLALCRLWSSALFSLSFFSFLILSISRCCASNRRCCAMLVNCVGLSFILLLYLIYRRCQVGSLTFFFFFADSLTRWLSPKYTTR